eukprot:3223124-Rhodomonas_salina.3
MAKLREDAEKGNEQRRILSRLLGTPSRHRARTALPVHLPWARILGTFGAATNAKRRAVGLASVSVRK